MTLFLAQNPKTRANVSHPFRGTRSGKTFARWLELLGRPEHVVLNASRKVGKVTWKDYDLEGVSNKIAQLRRAHLQKAEDWWEPVKFVALGKYAAGLFDRLGIRYFELPHPSGLSRKLNDKWELSAQLALCRVYLGRGDDS